jgi:hypothetical protein
MILTEERFFCMRCGPQPQEHAIVNVYDDRGGGPYFPYFSLKCRCGADGAYICDGSLASCNVEGGACLYHGCFVVGHPFPKGIVTTTMELFRRGSERASEKRRDAEASGLWSGAGPDTDDALTGPGRRGIF